jgi:hypothetical protein
VNETNAARHSVRQYPLWVISGHSDHIRSMSALPPKADIVEGDRHVRFVPKADVSNRSKADSYSITLSVVRLTSPER